ncbi:MAG: hypothetical protein ACYDHH_07580 [Solirubrobacteraceae bacterium]
MSATGVRIGTIFLIGLTLVACGSGSGSRSSGGRTGHAGGQARIAVGSSYAASPAIPPSFIGFSIELQDLPYYVGGDAAHPNPALVGLIRSLLPGQVPMVRLGGDSTDHSWWPTRGIAKPAGVDYALTPRWMALARGLAHALGGKLIVGLNMATGNSALATAEARAYVNGIGAGSLAAFELGNEPGYYGHLPWYRNAAGAPVRARPVTYNLADYTREFLALASRLPPALRLAGPGDGNLPGVAPERAFIAAAPRLAFVTMHRYPLIACTKDPARATYPSLGHMLSRTSSAGLANGIAPYVRLARAAGLPYRLDEINSVSCRGAPVSRTFASALWALDQLFQLARIGVAGVNFNTFKNSPYEPFSVSNAGGRASASITPMYYGLSMFAQAAPSGSRLLALTLQGGGAMRAWATRAADGTVRVVAINDSLTRSRPVSIAVAGWQGRGAVLTRLTASNAGATSGISMRREPVTGGRDGFTLMLPPASAAMLTIHTVP